MTGLVTVVIGTGGQASSRHYPATRCGSSRKKSPSRRGTAPHVLCTSSKAAYYAASEYLTEYRSRVVSARGWSGITATRARRS